MNSPKEFMKLLNTWASLQTNWIKLLGEDGVFLAFVVFEKSLDVSNGSQSWEALD